MNKNSWALLLLLCFFHQLSVFGYSSRNPQNQTQSYLGSDELLIINESAANISFHLRNSSKSAWKEFKLGPNKSNTYSNVTHIRVDSQGGKSVVYSIKYGKRYKIFWHSGKHIWDVAVLS
jgi:hypothetical protein